MSRAEVLTTIAGAKAASAAPDDDLRVRIDAAVAVASKFADSVDREARFPQEAFDELRAQRLLGIMLPRERAGEARSVSRRRADLLRARTRLLLDLDDLRDAPGQCRLSRQSFGRQRAPGLLSASHRRRAIASRLLDDRRPERRQCAFECIGDHARGRSNFAQPRRLGRLIRPRGGRDRLDGAAHRRIRCRPIRCSRFSSRKTTRSSARSIGTSWACAAPAAKAFNWKRRRARASAERTL